MGHQPISLRNQQEIISQFCNNFVKLLKWYSSTDVSSTLYTFLQFMDQFFPSVINHPNGVLLQVSIKLESQHLFDKIPRSFVLQQLLQFYCVCIVVRVGKEYVMYALYDQV